MNIDTSINLFMQNIETPILTSLSKIIDIALDPLTLIIASILIASVLYFTNNKKQSILLISTMAVAGILIKGFKFIFNRTRPIDMLIKESSNSLPSGHATIAIVFFGVLAFIVLVTKKNKLKFMKPIIITKVIFISLISGASRLYLRVHWFTDVIAGFVLGGIILISGIILYKKY